MRRLLTPALLSLALTAIAAAKAPTSLFTGKDLSGWTSPDKERFWKAENNILIGENDAELAGSYLWTERPYHDFVLEFEVRWTGEIDSGIDFRDPKIQLQLGVSRSLKRDMTGSFYVGKPGYPDAGQAKTVAQLMNGEGQWNHFRLEAKGDTFTSWINGKLASQYTDPKFSGAAPIGLQIHRGVKMKVEYRQLKLTEL